MLSANTLTLIFLFIENWGNVFIQYLEHPSSHPWHLATMNLASLNHFYLYSWGILCYLLSFYLQHLVQLDFYPFLLSDPAVSNPANCTSPISCGFIHFQVVTYPLAPQLFLTYSNLFYGMKVLYRVFHFGFKVSPWFFHTQMLGPCSVTNHFS